MYLYKNKTFIESFKKPQLNIIAGRPAMGKTMLALYISHEMIKERKTITFFTLELSSIQLEKRMFDLFNDIRMISELPEKIKRIHLNECADQYFLEIHDIKRKILLDELERKIADCALQNNSQIIIIDYVQLLIRSFDQDSKLDINVLLDKLRFLAKMYHIAIILLSQLDRKADIRKHPKFNDLLDLKRIINFNSDRVYLINRPERYGLILGEFGEDFREIMEVFVYDTPQKYIKFHLNIKYWI
ncbi:DnaB-like helicase C-terminal domain-containing protein [Butyricimonas faecihominis]|uniref:DnaB-like helicase C-terminal domain-containing protein n=1 Tax=Butyricimonas faecihominis TaxID=1472416 RepID=UPI0032C0F3ED